jgi:hypothetical protein
MIAGARRQKVGESGRLHLDRRLPFLLLHRLGVDQDPVISLARRVALNSPAYLVWLPQGGFDVTELDSLPTHFHLMVNATIEFKISIG